MSQGQAGGEGREQGNGRAPPLRCKHGTLPDVRVLAYAHSPLTMPSSASAVAPPPPLRNIVDVDACRMQCGGAHGGLRGAHIPPCKHA